MGDRFVVL